MTFVLTSRDFKDGETLLANTVIESYRIEVA